MKKILLPTDFSQNSWNAIAYALQLFKDDTCTFYLLNTYTPIVYHTEYVLVSPEQFDLGYSARDTSVRQLEEFELKMNQEFKNPNHTIETMAVFNMLIPEVKDIVKEKNIDYIVMGTKGATGAKEVLFGSNTVHMFKNIKCPILAIPDDFDFEPLKEVLFPTDYEIDYNDNHIKPITNITSLFITNLNILHVSYGYDLTEKQQSNKATLKKYLKDQTHLFHNVSNQSVPHAITDFQLKTRINMLIMINNKHSFFENLFFKSTINQIGFHLNLPFLVIPSNI